MKIIIAILCFVVFVDNVKAQASEDDEEKTHGFKKENLFTGGSIGLNFGQGQFLLGSSGSQSEQRQFSLGIGPHFGYSINKYIDVALSLNYTYLSQRDYFVLGDKVRQNNIGPGAFVRLFPINFLYAQAQFERNFVTLKYIPANNSNFQKEKITFAATSYLVGAGYANGREGGNTFYYFSILFDIGKDVNSPYVDELGRKNPIIRAGFNIALFQGGSRGGYRKSRDDY
jgi:hypothetical protein